MSVQTINTNIKPGCCPHGLPAGACPICSGMSGGATKVVTPAPQKDEWSYAKCYAVWQRMLAKEAQQENHEKSVIAFRAAIANFQKNIQAITSKTNTISLFLQSNLPKPLAKSINFISQKVLIPILKTLETLPNNIEKAMNTIQKTLTDISDKLIAIFGELKNKLEKQFQKSFKSFKKGIFMLLAIFNVETQNENDDKKINETKKILKLKAIKETLLSYAEDKNA